ncbi:MAG: hypothetical protein Q4C41_06580 [Eggerthellaceae bacterium]|nr:hypothetical protein [Eggerthellaceae bacterium]
MSNVYAGREIALPKLYALLVVRRKRGAFSQVIICLLLKRRFLATTHALPPLLFAGQAPLFVALFPHFTSEKAPTITPS